ncbi:hypothetical protein F4859DRAFT_203314 [Xylaria cf. heliscus]|nr:hypothetical protein F4859DRAFT_203314 [Xylaria cf. heliscus]
MASKPNYGEYSPPPENPGCKRKSLAPLFCVSLVLWLGVLAIGVVLGLGCINNDNLYIVRLSANRSSPIQVSLGYAGTCVKTTGASVCISHAAFESDNLESIAEQFQRELGYQNTNTTNTTTTTNGTESGTGTGTGTTPGPTPPLNSTRRLFPKDVPSPSPSPNATTTTTQPLDLPTLKTLLSISSTLQTTVFPLGPPLSFLIIFALSTITLWTLLPSPTDTRAYKAMLAGAVLLNSYGLTLGFMVALATRQAGAGLLVIPQAAYGTGTGTGEDAVEVGAALEALQWVAAGVAAVAQACVAWLFVQRRAVAGDVQVSMLPAVVNNISFTKTRRCCCCF